MNANAIETRRSGTGIAMNHSQSVPDLPAQ